MYGGTDYYTVLGLDHYATPKEIKQAYRRLAKEHHPDVNPDNPDASSQFQQINEAYETLYNNDKRRLYDTGFDATFRNTYTTTHAGSAQDFHDYRYSDYMNTGFTQSGFTQSGFTQSGYGYRDFGAHSHFGAHSQSVRYEDTSFLQKVASYFRISLKDLPPLHFIVLAGLAIWLLLLPIDSSMSLSNITKVPMRLTFFIFHALVSSYWVERSCHGLEKGSSLLITMVITTNMASSLIAGGLAVGLQLVVALLFNLPQYIIDAWSKV